MKCCWFTKKILGDSYFTWLPSQTPKVKDSTLSRWKVKSTNYLPWFPCNSPMPYVPFQPEQSSLACASFPSLHTEADFPSASPSCSSTLQVIWRFSKRCFLSRIFPQAICVIPDQGVLCSWAEKSSEVPELRGLKSKEGGWPSERSRGEGDCWLRGNGRIGSWRR